MIVTTTDGVEVELWRGRGERLNTFAVLMRCDPRTEDQGPWLESGHENLAAAAAWVSIRAWDEVRERCL